MSWPIDPILKNPVLKWRESQRVRQYRVAKEKFKEKYGNQKLSAEMIERVRQGNKVEEVAVNNQVELTLNVAKRRRPVEVRHHSGQPECGVGQF